MNRRKRWTLVALIALTAACGALTGGTVAQQKTARLKPGEKQFLNPAGLQKPTSYTHVVTAQPGRVVWIAGQVSLNEKGEVVGAGDLRAQARQVLENLATALKAAGASWTDVVKINTYVVNYAPEMLPALREARAQYLLATDRLPASTLVGVQALARPEFLIEIEVVAVLP
jgi:enamine deaminase RidA (YjgF/YER057c/UK114 family)